MDQSPFIAAVAAVALTVFGAFVVVFLSGVDPVKRSQKFLLRARKT